MIRIPAKSFCLLLLVVNSLPAQTNETFDLNAGGRIYRNARIDRVTDADAVVYFDGGIAKIPLEDLPGPLRKKYGYDPLKAAQAVKEEAEAEKAKLIAAAQKSAQFQAAEAAKAGPPARVSVTEILENIGYDKCVTSTGTILISGLPPQTRAYLNRVIELENSIRQRELAADRNEEQIRLAEARTPIATTGDLDYLDDIAIRRQRIERRRIDAENERRYIQQLRASLDALKATADDWTALALFSTGNSYAGLPIWKTLGFAPPPTNAPVTMTETNQ